MCRVFERRPQPGMNVSILQKPSWASQERIITGRVIDIAHPDDRNLRAYWIEAGGKTHGIPDKEIIYIQQIQTPGYGLNPDL